MRLLLAVCFALLPLQARAFIDLWSCEATERLVCTTGESCNSAEPYIDQLEIMPITGRLSFCISGQCYEGVMELEREGWPDYRMLGTATVEALPLPRRYMGGKLYFVAFDEETSRFTLSSLNTRGQDASWFDCRPWGE